MRVNVEKVLERDQKLSELDDRAGNCVTRPSDWHGGLMRNSPASARVVKHPTRPPGHTSRPQPGVGQAQSELTSRLTRSSGRGVSHGAAAAGVRLLPRV